MVKCQDIVEEWFAKHYRCYGIVRLTLYPCGIPLRS